MMKKHNSRLFIFLTVVLYSLLNIITLIHHEPWRDEASPWLVARDLDLPSLFRQMNYEGTPALWYILLVPFAKAGFPYISMSIIHLILAIAVVTIFVLRAPFSKTTKFLFVFSYYMAYEYSIIARQYNSSILLLFLIAAFYHRRFIHPLRYSSLIFLLFNTNVYSFSIASSLAILFIGEFFKNGRCNKIGYVAIFVMCLGGLLAVMQLIPAADNVSSSSYVIDMDGKTFVIFVKPFNILKAIKNAFFVTSDDSKIYIAIAFIVLNIALLSIIKKPAALFIIAFSYFGLFYVFAFRRFGGLRHHGFILMILLFGIWISTYYKESNWFKNKLWKNFFSINFSKLSLIMINFCLFISCVFCVNSHYKEYRYIFSGAKDMADFIVENKLDNHIIVAHRSPMASALLPYLPGKRFWYAGIEGYGTFITWNKKFAVNTHIPHSEVIARMGKAFPDTSDVLLLLNEPLDMPESRNFTLLYKTDKPVGSFGIDTSEEFYLYGRSENF